MYNAQKHFVTHFTLNKKCESYNLIPKSYNTFPVLSNSLLWHNFVSNCKVPLQTNNISDQNILSMIAESNLEAWVHLYNKYSSAMYGIICNLTADRTLAEEIFKETFLQLKEKQILSKVTHALCPCLLRHTNIFARQQLKARGITFSNSPFGETSLIDILCSQNISFKQAASNFNITEEVVKKNLHLEILKLRSQSKEERATQHQQYKEKYSYNFNSNQ